MATDLQKHRANIMQIIGFALMTPVGHLILNLIELEFTIKLLFYILIALLLLYFGIISLLRSIEVIEGKN